jgi:hypothetical protein
MGRYHAERVLMISLAVGGRRRIKNPHGCVNPCLFIGRKTGQRLWKMKKYLFSFINADDIIISFKKNPMVIEQTL